MFSGDRMAVNGGLPLWDILIGSRSHWPLRAPAAGFEMRGEESFVLRARRLVGRLCPGS